MLNSAVLWMRCMMLELKFHQGRGVYLERALRRTPPAAPGPSALDYLCRPEMVNLYVKVSRSQLSRAHSKGNLAQATAIKI